MALAFGIALPRQNYTLHPCIMIASKTPKSPLWQRPWLWGVGGVLLILMGTGWLLRPRTSNRWTDLMVPVQEETVVAKIKATGTVEPIQNVNVSPKNPGRLQELRVEQGDRVTAGQVVAVMENQTIAAELRQTEAALRQAIANRNSARVRIRSQIAQAQIRLQGLQAQLRQSENRFSPQRDQLTAQVQAAQARQDRAQEQYRRYQQLAKDGAISTDQLDEIALNLRSAQANLQDAQGRLRQTNATQPPEQEQLQQNVREAQTALQQLQNSQASDLAQNDAAVALAQAQRDRARLVYQETFVAAPFGGIVTQRYATEGAFVTPTTSASSTISATSTSILALARGLEVIAKIPEIDLPQIRAGQTVEIVADAYPDRVFRGVVRTIAPEAIVEQNVTSFEVRIRLESGEDQLRSRMNANVTFVGKALPKALLIPTVAIVTEKGQTGVMVLGNNQQPEFRPITVGISFDRQTQVLSGVRLGEKVFIDLPKEFRKRPQS